MEEHVQVVEKTNSQALDARICRRLSGRNAGPGGGFSRAETRAKVLARAPNRPSDRPGAVVDAMLGGIYNPTVAAFSAAVLHPKSRNLGQAA